MYALSQAARRFLAWLVVLMFALCLLSLNGLISSGVLWMGDATVDFLHNTLPTFGVIAFMMYMLATFAGLLCDPAREDSSSPDR